MAESYGSGTTPQPGDTKRMLMVKELYATGSGGGGGGGGSTGVTTGNYGGGIPSFTPSTSGAVAIDTSTGTIWWYFNGTWQ